MRHCPLPAPNAPTADDCQALTQARWTAPIDSPFPSSFGCDSLLPRATPWRIRLCVICAGNRVARKIQFAERIQSDLGRPVVLANIFRFPVTPNQWFFPRCLVSARGAFRDRHEREMGCGGRD